MRKKSLLAAIVVAFGLVIAFGTNSYATPDEAGRCDECHSGGGVGVVATLSTSNATDATYDVVLTGATDWAVYDGSTRVALGTGATGQFTVAVGKTYDVFGVNGPTEADGLGTTSVSPAAAAGTFTVTASAGAGGVIAPSGAQVVTAGSDAVFTITPNSGYHIADVLVDSGSVGALSTYTFTNVGADHIISATFAADGAGTFTVTASAGAGGVISPSGACVCSAGSDAAFTITPNSGYHIADVLVDSGSVGAVASYTFTNVTTGHTISASFAADGARIPSTLTIRTSRTAAYIGQTFILSGLARPTPGMIGQNMVVYVKKPGKSYWTYSSRRTIYVGPSGTAEWWYRYYLDPNKVASGLVRRGTYLFKAVYNGDATYAASQSTIISVLVR